MGTEDKDENVGAVTTRERDMVREVEAEKVALVMIAAGASAGENTDGSLGAEPKPETGVGR